MLGTPVITDAQAADFERDGYLVVRCAFDASEMRDIESWARELSERPEEPGKHWVYWEKNLLDPDRKIVCRIENIQRCHAGFAELTAALAGPVGRLLGEDAVLFKEKINYKLPGADGFEPHQDSQAGWEKYASYFVNVLVCIDEATEENGCLKVAVGHHKGGIFREWEPLTEDDMEGMEFVSCTTKPGDLVFFDSYTPHASEPNLTDRPRRLYYVTYNRASEGDHQERYYADKRKSYPPDIEREPGREYVYRV